MYNIIMIEGKMLLKNNKSGIQIYYCTAQTLNNLIEEVSRTCGAIITVKIKPMEKLWLVSFLFFISKFFFLRNILFLNFNKKN